MVVHRICGELLELNIISSSTLFDAGMNEVL